MAKKYPFLELREARRLVRAYGTRADRVLGEARSIADLGRRFGPSLTEAEVRYLMDQEWATSAEDIVWRRSKLGLHMTAAEQAALEEFVASLLSRHRSRPWPAMREGGMHMIRFMHEESFGWKRAHWPSVKSLSAHEEENDHRDPSYRVVGRNDAGNGKSPGVRRYGCGQEMD